jgi:hypothetical protein
VQWLLDLAANERQRDGDEDGDGGEAHGETLVLWEDGGD